MKLLNKGSFTEVYEHTEDTVLLVTKCQVKLAILEYCQDNVFAPVLYKDGDKIISKKYIEVTNPKEQLKTDHYQYYLDLVNAMEGGLGYVDLRNRLETISNNIIKESAIQILDSIYRYNNNKDTIYNDISKQNILTDEEGNLILNDIFNISP